MAVYKIKWSNLLNLAELEFLPEAPKQLSITDEVTQSISWLTACTLHDRKLLRCDENGVLLVGYPWNNLIEVETDELLPQSTVPDTFTATVPNKGVLVASSTQLVKLSFVRFAGGDIEDVYIPSNNLYWFGHQVYTVTVTTVPATGGSTSRVAVTAFN